MESVIFGAGYWGQILKRGLEKIYGVHICAMISNNESEWGERTDNVVICSPQSLIGMDYDNIFVCANNKSICSEMETQLLDMGIPREKIENMSTTTKYTDAFQVRYDLKNIPLAISIETTNFCNAKCWFCPNSHLKRKKEFMSDETFSTIIRRLKDEEINVQRFGMHINGEPLLDKKLFDRIEQLHKLYPSSSIAFTTNFSMASDDIIEKILRSSLTAITISINALDRDEYYSIMNLPYDKTMKNIERFIQRKKGSNSPIAVNFSIVARKDNMDTVEKFQKKYAEAGNVRIIHLGAWVNEEKPDNFDEGRNTSKLCGEIYTTISILSSGEFALCCFDAEGSVHMNIRETSIKDAFCSPYFNKIRSHHLKYGKTNSECVNCSFR